MASILRQHGDHFRMAAPYRLPTALMELADTQAFAPGRGGVIGRVLLQCKSVQIPDVLADPEYRFQENARLGGFRTLLGVPLLREGTPIGIVNLMRTDVRPFTEKQIELLETFADQAVIAIENTRLFEAEQQRTRELTELISPLGIAVVAKTGETRKSKIARISTGRLHSEKGHPFGRRSLQNNRAMTATSRLPSKRP
jgi:two-component system, NtrC family, sensor kinase